MLLQELLSLTLGGNKNKLQTENGHIVNFDMVKISGYLLTQRETAKKVSILLNKSPNLSPFGSFLPSTEGKICCLLCLKTKTTNWRMRKIKTVILEVFQEKIIF